MAEPTESGGSGNPILDLLENLPGMGGSEALGGVDMSFLENLMGDPNIQRMTQALSNDPSFLEMAREVQDKMLSGQLGGLSLSEEDGRPSAPASGGAEGAEGMDPARYMEAMQRMMANPDFVAAAETLGRDLMSRVADPETACMLELFSNPAHRDLLREEMEKLEEDDGLGPVLRSMREQGDGAVMEHMMNPETMGAMGRRFQTLFTRPDVRERFRHILEAPQPAVEQGGEEGGQGRSRGADEAEAEADASAASPAVEEAPTVLSLASAGDEAGLRALLARPGTDPDAADEEGRRAMHFAAGYGELGCLRALLEAGADADVRDSNDNTALHYAAGYGNGDSAAVLLAAGADAGRRNQEGKTALMVARLNGQEEVVALLDAKE